MSKVYNIRNYEKNRNKIIESFRIVAFLYLITMLCVFPYYLKNSYSSCRSDKYHFFVIVTLIAMCAIGVFFAINYQKRPGGAVDIPLVDYANRSQLNLADISLLTFWGVNLLSSIFATISGGDFYVFFNGDNGRNMGLLTITMIVVAYFIISRFFVYKSRLFCVILICMSFMSILAILNYYYIDPLSLFERYQRQQHVIKNFTSTIGNKNFFSSLICIALPLAMGVAIAIKDKITYCIANICVGIQFAALIVATSDGGFLGCFAGIATLFFVSAKDLKRLSRFFVCLATLLVFSKSTRIFSHIFQLHQEQTLINTL